MNNAESKLEYYNFWNVTQPEVKDTKIFTDMQIALMEGGHSLEEQKIEKFSFIKTLKNTLP